MWEKRTANLKQTGGRVRASPRLYMSSMEAEEIEPPANGRPAAHCHHIFDSSVFFLRTPVQDPGQDQ